jgi:hypothetical protein
MSSPTESETVRALLSAAQLVVGESEFAQLVRDFGIVRAQADALYLQGLDDWAFSLSFDPMIPD